VNNLIRFVALVGISAPLYAQQTPDRGALLIRSGNDTVVTDRFIRTADTLKGSVQAKGQPRIDYLALQVPAEQAEKLASLIRAGGNKDVTVRVFPARSHRRSERRFQQPRQAANQPCRAKRARHARGLVDRQAVGANAMTMRVVP
jgi:hypothetical protein